MPLKFIKRLLGKDDAVDFVPPAPAAAPRPRPPQRQVFAGRLAAEPAFALDLDAARLIKACEEHMVCPCTPHFEQQRIYRTLGKPDANGNMPIEYEGIAVSCSAISEHGAKVGQEEGQSRPFRYGDRDHVLACCCGDPKKCPFYRKMQQERERLSRHLKA